MEMNEYRKGYKDGYAVAERKYTAMIKMVIKTVVAELEAVLRTMS